MLYIIYYIFIYYISYILNIKYYILYIRYYILDIMEYISYIRPPHVVGYGACETTRTNPPTFLISEFLISNLFQNL